MMQLPELLERCPHLASPATLAFADTNGKWRMAPHLAVVNKELVDIGLGLNDRLGVHMPFQHGKSVLCSHYFPAWILLLFPFMRIVLASYEEHYSGTFGSKVREVIRRFGGPHGIELRKDTKSKNEWNIEGHGGGLVCKGLKGGLTGRPADMLILDDVIKDAEQAQSKTILDNHWDWYSTVAYSRLGPVAPIIMVTTRWVKDDLPGRIYREAMDTGEKWRVVKFKAIAGENDILGRKAGDALWPERVPLKRLQLIQQKRGRWFKACWQQEPPDEEGLLFKPQDWPIYGSTYSVPNSWWVMEGATRRVYYAKDVTIVVSIDVSLGKKKTSDHTAIEVSGLLPANSGLTRDGRTLIFESINDRIRLEHIGGRLADVCRQWNPNIVAGDDDNLSQAMLLEYRRHPEIPEVRCMPIGNRDKKVRASAAIIDGENHRVHLPQNAPWLSAFKEQLSSWTGTPGEDDDMVDCRSITARVVQGLRQPIRESREDPLLFTSGKSAW
jgi:phage terminase large subunit-like protein